MFFEMKIKNYKNEPASVSASDVNIKPIGKIAR